MPSDVTRDEFKHLTTRVDVVEREVEGEKLVSRHILVETRRNTADLAGMRTDMKNLDQKIDRVEAKLESRIDGVETRLDRVEAKIDGLARNLPTIVGDEMRKVLRERGKR
jgi:tetrahydromethanopterin S-methyltransferase subunit G